MTDNRTTELLRELRRTLEKCRRTEEAGFDTYWITAVALDTSLDELEQAIAATLGSGREHKLELLVKQLWYLVNHRSGYGYAAALESIEELGIEVDE